MKLKFWRADNKQERIYSNVVDLGEEISQGAEFTGDKVNGSRLDSTDSDAESKMAQDSELTKIHIADIRSTIFNIGDLKFVYLPPGTFVMGSPEYESGRNNDEEQHEVCITKGFNIQITPVTVKQWRQLMGDNPSCFPTASEACPVDGVSWNECQDFIRKLNLQGEATYRLPTESEWEYACRAGTITSFANGEISQLFCGLDDILDQAGWYCGNSDRKTHPVAQKDPNPGGLYDMHGNLCEWCHDWYGKYPSNPQEDPHGPMTGPGKVIRGGSWFSSAKSCRSACRSHWLPDSKGDFIGFRLVKEGKP